MGGLTMPEFMFRNLSVKLDPDVTDTGIDPGCGIFEPFTDIAVCHQTCFYPNKPPTLFACSPVGTTMTNLCGPVSSTVCEPGTQPGGFVDPDTRIVLPAGADIQQELQVLKSKLQTHMAAVDAKLAEVQRAAKPTSVEQIDALKSHLLDAVAELDQQRTQLEGSSPTPAQG
jgi:hypothetical protein